MKNSIIVLDDDFMSLRSLEHTLKEWDYNPVCFSEFNRDFVSNDFSNVICCIIDYKLNYMDGISVIKFIKKLYPDLISILISGYSIDEEVFNTHASTFSYFMPKPININQLKTFLHNINKEGK